MTKSLCFPCTSGSSWHWHCKTIKWRTAQAEPGMLALCTPAFLHERADHPLGLSSVDVGAVEASTHRGEPTGASDEPVQRCLMEVPAEPSKDTHNGAKWDPDVLHRHIWWWRGLFKPSTILGCDSVKCF